MTCLSVVMVALMGHKVFSSHDKFWTADLNNVDCLLDSDPLALE